MSTVITTSAVTSATLNAGAIVGTDSSLGITGEAAAQGGAIVATGGASSTSGNAGGAVSLVGGAAGATGVGGAANLTAAAGGSSSGKGGKASVTAGAGTAGNASGGSVVVTAGAKNGSGIDGGLFLRAGGGQIFRQQPVSTAETDAANAIAAADMINGICVHTVSTGRALSTPTGAAILAACPTDIAAGDSFDLTVITVGTGSDDISTLTAGDSDVTFVGPVTVGGTNPSGGSGSVGTWRFRYTGGTAFVGYRIA